MTVTAMAATTTGAAPRRSPWRGLKAEMRRRLQRDGGGVACFVSGGAADEIAPYLNDPLQVVDNLVLEGALALADEE